MKHNLLIISAFVISTWSCTPAPRTSMASKISAQPLDAPRESKAKVNRSMDSVALETYARQLVGTLAGRPLKLEERNRLKAEGEAGLAPLLNAWLEEDFFAQAFRGRVETLLGTSGSRDKVDFNLPGNLASYIVKERLPIGTLLTADYCVDAKLSRVACDTGAPFASGVMTTRGFMMAHNGRFNLGRAISMMNVFACAHYPMSDALQPRTPKEQLIENFRIATKEEAEAKGSTGFGNGAACYLCHSQFAPHTQLFVKFDDQGLYRADASGLQSKELEFGRADKGLYASHFVEAEASASEASDMLGTAVENLPAAAKVLSEHPAFVSCMGKHALAHALGLDSEATNQIPHETLDAIAKTVTTTNPQVADVYKAVLTHPSILDAFAEGVTK